MALSLEYIFNGLKFLWSLWAVLWINTGSYIFYSTYALVNDIKNFLTKKQANNIIIEIKRK